MLGEGCGYVLDEDKCLEGDVERGLVGDEEKRIDVLVQAFSCK